MKTTSTNWVLKISQLRCVLCAGFLCFALSGCLVAPPHESLQHKCGPYPDDYQAMIMDYLKQDLRHPDSIKDFKIIKPPEIVILDSRFPTIRLHKGFEVWEFFIVYDVKNDDGVYIGRDLHVVWIRHNRLVAFDYNDLNLKYRIKERKKNPGY